MFDILKTIGEVLIALFIIRYLIQRYNTLGRIREPVRRALADISHLQGPAGSDPASPVHHCRAVQPAGKQHPHPGKPGQYVPAKRQFPGLGRGLSRAEIESDLPVPHGRRRGLGGPDSDQPPGV